MGARIKAVDIARAGFNRRGSVDLEAKAAGECLKRAGVDPRQLGILINVGVYRDRHLVEPAMSSFIQQRIGANETFDGSTSTFSFDLANGGCGMVTGFMVADGFLRSGLSAHGLVVGGDAEPVPGLSEGYDYTPAASAVLLTSGEEDDGFVAFRIDTHTEYIDSFSGRMAWTGGTKKRNRLILNARPSYADDCASCAADSLKAFLAEAGLERDDVDLLLTSQSPPGVVEAIGEKTGLGDRIVDLEGAFGHVHTAGIGMALSRAVSDGRFARSRRVIFLGVGAGITTALALYTNR